MQGKMLDGHACAMLSLTTRACWSEDLPQPLSRPMAHRMLTMGALEGLVLRDVAGIEAALMERAQALLGRIGAVYACIEAYERAGYRLLFPGRENWPSALGALGAQQPLFLWAKGNLSLLTQPQIAVAGSRRIRKETWEAAHKTGEMIAKEGHVLVSGGASGADDAAQQGAWAKNGSAILVPALPAEQLLLKKEAAKAMEEGRLLLLCDTLPDEPFSAQKALTRNHTIYALGSASLVVAAREGVGGSWRGAADCMRGGFGHVWVWEGKNADTQGNRALEKLGAKRYTLDAPLKEQLACSRQVSLFDEQG